MTGHEPPATDDRRIWDLWLTHTYQASIVAADEMGIFEALAEKPARIAEVAALLHYDERASGVLMRLLASLDLLAVRDGRFHLTNQARTYLLKSSPFYWGPMMRSGVNERHVSKIAAALKKNSADFTDPQGAPQPAGTGRYSDEWASGNIPIERGRKVAAMMHAHSLVPAIGVARSYDFTGVRSTLDVGAGSGCYAIAIARAYPEMRCGILELPSMCEVARGYVRADGLEDRIETIPLDMFRQPWPTGYDAILFSNIWHDWNFRTCQWLAERAYETLPTGGRILLHEMLLDDDGSGPATAASFSMLMLLATQGQQFTFGELKDILEKAGFVHIQMQRTSVYYSITTGYKEEG